MKYEESAAAICGLFCGTCPSFIDGACGGCLSDTCCCDCFNGFRDCATAHDAVRCYECAEFPCEKLRDFSTKHVVDGIGHHSNVIRDLTDMKERGVEEWLASQAAAHTCKTCGRTVPWYGRICEFCKSKVKK